MPRLLTALAAALSLLVLAPLPAAAQEDDVEASDDGETITVDDQRRAANVETIIPPVQEVDFEVVEVNGTMVKPYLEWTTGDQQRVYTSFIKLRTDFNPELQASTRTIR